MIDLTLGNCLDPSRCRLAICAACFSAEYALRLDAANLLECVRIAWPAAGDDERIMRYAFALREWIHGLLFQNRAYRGPLTTEILQTLLVPDLRGPLNTGAV